MKFNPVLIDKTNTIGRGSIEDFEGSSTAVDPKRFRKAMDFIEEFEGRGFSVSTLSFGIEERSDGQPGALVIFLDELQKLGLVIAPLLLEADD